MSFYNEPTFWVFMGTFFGGLFGFLKLLFIYIERSNVKKASLNMGVERFKSETIQKTLDYLNGVVTRLETQDIEIEKSIAALQESVVMNGVIEKGLAQMVHSLETNYKEFEIRITKIAASMQLVVDRVDNLDKAFKQNLGKVIKL